MSLRKKNLFKGAENWSGIDIKENITLILIMLLHKKMKTIHSMLRRRKNDTMLCLIFCFVYAYI